MSSSGGEQSGGGVTFPAFSGSGSPEGVLAGTIGQYYEDTDTGNLYNKAADDGMDTGWVGPLVTGNFDDDEVYADAPTTVTADGALHDVEWIVATPPGWADSAGNITVPGLYVIGMTLTVNAGPTLPSLFYGYQSPANLLVTSNVDGIGFFGLSEQLVDVQALATIDMPFPITGKVGIQTDMTAALDCTMFVERAVYNVP